MADFADERGQRGELCQFMNSKKAKHEARLLRRNRAQRESNAAESAANDAEIDRLGRLAKQFDARGERLTFPPMSVKDRKRLSKKPLISEEQRKSVELAKEIMAKCQGRENERK